MRRTGELIRGQFVQLLVLAVEVLESRPPFIVQFVHFRLMRAAPHFAVCWVARSRGRPRRSCESSLSL